MLHRQELLSLCREKSQRHRCSMEHSNELLHGYRLQLPEHSVGQMAQSQQHAV
jgi:hypothetical protein